MYLGIVEKKSKDRYGYPAPVQMSILGLLYELLMHCACAVRTGQRAS